MSVEKSLSYAALILADSEVEITSDKLSTLLSNANIEADKIWSDIYAKALEGQDLKELFFNFSSAPVSSGAVAGASSSGAAAEEEEAAEEPEAEESDADMGFGLFD